MIKFVYDNRTTCDWFVGKTVPRLFCFREKDKKGYLNFFKGELQFFEENLDFHPEIVIAACKV